MKTILMTIFFLFSISNLNAAEQSEPNAEGFYSSCYGVERSLNSYQSCINRNFRSAARDFNTFLTSCYGSSFSLESCINRNFSNLGRTTSRYFSRCYGINNNPMGFESCVNSNFRRLSYTLEQSLVD